MARVRKTARCVVCGGHYKVTVLHTQHAGRTIHIYWQRLCPVCAVCADIAALQLRVRAKRDKAFELAERRGISWPGGWIDAVVERMVRAQLARRGEK